MKRSNFLKSGLALFSCGMTGSFMDKRVFSFDRGNSEDHGDVNIIFILADDLGYHDLGCYGQKNILTPNIDQLADEGMRFTQCYAGSTVCAPSRNTLMTGKDTGHCTVRGNYLLDDEGKRVRLPLPKHDFTIADMLKENSKTTGIISKWGLGNAGSTGIPKKQGFDYWYGFLDQHKAHNYYPPYLWENQHKVVLKGNKNGQQKEYIQNLFTQHALNFIKGNQNHPFFLYLPYTIPHAKYEIPNTEPYTNKKWTHQEKVYAAMVTRLDKDVGRIRAFLRKLNLDKRTIIFFASDNGAAKRWEGRFNSTGIFRGIKRSMYEGGLRVPMVVSYPGVIPSGKVNDMPWYFSDVMPTLADIVNITPPAKIDGVSIWPALQGKSQSMENRIFYWEYFKVPPNMIRKQAIRWNNWKAVKNSKHALIELYNLSVDPSESNDIANSHQRLVKKMKGWMKSERTASSYWHIS
jgi:arylsulfatase A-like enzyme